MTDRMYRAILGFLLLLALTFDIDVLLYFIILVLFFEGITNLRVPKLVCRFRSCLNTSANPVEYVHDPYNSSFRFNVESERVWRLVVGLLLAVTFYFYEQLWFFPWFMGFAIFGAGISGVCPVLLAIRWAGFK
jgi:hypothetical protein